jgi:hypothetical protein
MVATRSMSSNPAHILHHVKMPDQHLTTLEQRTIEETYSMPMTDQTLPLPPSRQAELDAIAAATYCLIDLDSDITLMPFHFFINLLGNLHERLDFCDQIN